VPLPARRQRRRQVDLHQDDVGRAQAHAGEILFEGKPMHFASPRDAMEAGIATVYQDLAMIPLMSVSRNFFMGNEPVKKIGIPFFDRLPTRPTPVTMEEMRKMGINLRVARPGGGHAVGRRTPDGGDRPRGAISAPRC
jgi:simple sugar transport system ATP-binding protein